MDLHTDGSFGIKLFLKITVGMHIIKCFEPNAEIANNYHNNINQHLNTARTEHNRKPNNCISADVAVIAGQHHQ